MKPFPLRLLLYGIIALCAGWMFKDAEERAGVGEQNAEMQQSNSLQVCVRTPQSPLNCTPSNAPAPSLRKAIRSQARNGWLRRRQL